MDEKNRKKNHRRIKRAGVSLLALWVMASAGLAGCSVSHRTAELSADLTQPGQEVQEAKTEEEELDFRCRFYAASPDNLQLLTAEELEKWEESEKREEELREGKSGWGTVLADFPDLQVTMYGYLDPEKPFQGVMIRCGDSVSYFPEIVYMSDSCQMPDVEPDSSGSMFTVSFHSETGTKRSRDLLCVFFKSESGTMTADFFTEEDYLSQMGNRFSLSIQKGEQKGTLIRQDGKELGQADLSWAGEEEITGLNVADRVHITLESPVQMDVEIGITANGKEPRYKEGLTVTAPIEILICTYEDGSRGAEFLVGEVEQKAEETEAEEKEAAEGGAADREERG